MDECLLGKQKAYTQFVEADRDFSSNVKEGKGLFRRQQIRDALEERYGFPMTEGWLSVRRRERGQCVQRENGLSVEAAQK